MFWFAFWFGFDFDFGFDFIVENFLLLFSRRKVKILLGIFLFRKFSFSCSGEFEKVLEIAVEVSRIF